MRRHSDGVDNESDSPLAIQLGKFQPPKISRICCWILISTVVRIYVSMAFILDKVNAIWQILCFRKYRNGLWRLPPDPWYVGD